jgi:hypothetical protein
MMRVITTLLLCASAVGLIGWDVVVALNTVPGDTISELMQEVGYRVRAIPLALGVVMGHLFFPGKHERPAPAWLTLGILGVAVGSFDLAFPLKFSPAYPFAVGLPVGWALWPQKPKEK